MNDVPVVQAGSAARVLVQTETDRLAAVLVEPARVSDAVRATVPAVSEDLGDHRFEKLRQMKVHNEGSSLRHP